ncbi:YraN family protein [soil metagenome]
MNTRRTGDMGEEIALDLLSGMGYELVERNYRTRYGEIDLILRDGETLVFVEVKLRHGTEHGDPLESVTPRKQGQVRAIAEQYLQEVEPEYEEMRFDVVGILISGGRPTITHLEDAF